MLYFYLCGDEVLISSFVLSKLDRWVEVHLNGVSMDALNDAHELYRQHIYRICVKHIST